MKRLYVASMALVPGLGWTQTLTVDWQIAAAAGTVAAVPANGTWALAVTVLALAALGLAIARRSKGGLLALLLLVTCLPWERDALQAAVQAGEIELYDDNRPHVESIDYWQYEVINRTGKQIRLTRVELDGGGVYAWDESSSDPQCGQGTELAANASCRVYFRSADLN